MAQQTHPELAKDIRQLPDKYLECRTIGHAWHTEYIGPVGRTDDPDLMERAKANIWSPDGVRILHCSRCRTQRLDFCIVGYRRKAYSYRLVSRQYRYPDNYRVPGAHQNRHLLHEELFGRQVH